MRHFPEEKIRVESGPIQFGTDWPGVFLRGDNALYYANVLSEILAKLDNETIEDVFMIASLEGLKNELSACATTWAGTWIAVENERCTGVALCLDTMELASADDVTITELDDISDEDWAAFCEKWPGKLVPREG